MTPITWSSGSVKRPITRPSHHLVRAHHPRRPLAFGLGERLLDVGHLNVEGDVAFVALGPGGNALADADAVRIDVSFARDRPVLELVVRVDVPAEEVRVEALQASSPSLPVTSKCTTGCPIATPLRAGMPARFACVLSDRLGSGI